MKRVARASHRSAARICFVGAFAFDVFCCASLFGQPTSTRTYDSTRRSQIRREWELRQPRLEKAVSSTRTPIPKDLFSMGHPVSKRPLPKAWNLEQFLFRTWSLFLINNPQWAVAQSNDKIKSLYDQFEAYGRAIGPDNLAVWFWTQDDHTKSLYKGVDVDRAAAFCTKLKLPPSGGPYILVTSDYPGEGLIDNPYSFFPTSLKSYYTVSLNNKSADEIMQVLTRVADKITADRLADLDSSSKGYWSAWQRIFEAIRDFLSSRQMTVSIKTPISDVQIK